MNIAVLGKGNVGATLGRRWAEAGHGVMFGVRAPKHPGETTVQDAVRGAEVVVLAIPSQAVSAEFFDGLDLDGKVLIDCTNPIRADFSGLDSGEDPSGGEMVARLAPGARVVKAFNTIGFDAMADPVFAGEPATLLIAGDDPAASATTAALARDLGFEPLDAGPLSMAHYLEATAWVWISLAVKQGLGRGIAFVLHRRS